MGLSFLILEASERADQLLDEDDMAGAATCGGLMARRPARETLEAGARWVGLAGRRRYTLAR
jgi:hypothetical protein